MRKAFENIKDELDKERIATSKKIKNLRNEIDNIKTDYKQCLDALLKETYERNKAETLNRVLKDTLEAERKLKENQSSSPNLDDRKDGRNEVEMRKKDGKHRGNI